jgi:isoleucyl-tRNA synthetase
MRWYLYTASPPGQERRFSSDLVSEVVRSFTLTLWNTYSFFVTYANLDGWKPNSGGKVQYSALDNWLRAELHALVRDITIAFESYDVLGATRPIETFIDHLSNWFLRRSRRRFWKTESDADKDAAYATLYEALVTVSSLLAPTMPFIAEELYRNLVLTVNPDAPKSVHMVDWPKHDEACINDALVNRMNLVMRLVSLGHAARNKSGLKVRQPLQEAAFAVSNNADASVIEEYAELLQDELNVKKVRALSAASEAASYELMPLPKQLGQKYKDMFPQVRNAILTLDAEKAALDLMAGKPVKIEVAGNVLEILPEEVEVRMQAREGFSVASEGAYVAALVISLTPELVNEGLAREFVRRVQEARKQADFEISDRIKIFYSSSDNMRKAVDQFKEYIKDETLAVILDGENMPDRLPNMSDEFEGESVTLWLDKI